MKVSIHAAVVAAIVLCAATAPAATTAEKCEAAKNKVAGAYYACREKAEAAAIVKQASPDFSKCSTKFDDKWAAAETKAAGDCPDDVLTADVSAYLASQAADAAAIIAGANGVPICGDDEINAVGEQCDGSDLGGESCDTLGHTVGALACSASCELDVSGCLPCPGFAYEGACWVLGGFGGDCDTACTGAGLTYDTATATIAGSGGTDAECEDVLTGLGLPGTALDFPSQACTDGGGCGFTFLSDRLRCASPATLSTVATPGFARACACQ